MRGWGCLRGRGCRSSAKGADPHEAVRAAVNSAATADAKRARLLGSPPSPGARSCQDRQLERATDPFELADRIRRTGGRLVATGGCFDLLHRGHVNLLRQARALGDALVVCLNSDLGPPGQGHGRPLVTEKRPRPGACTRLAAVDGVVVFDEDTPAELLAKLRRTSGSRAATTRTGRCRKPTSCGRSDGHDRAVPVVDGYSTSRLVDTATSTGRLDQSAVPTVPQEAS